MKKHGILTAILTLFLVNLVSCGNTNFSGNPNKVNSIDALPQVPEEAPRLESLQVIPADVIVPIGSITPYQAIAVYSDGAEKDVSLLADWSVREANLAKVGKDGSTVKVYAEALGDTLVEAVYNEIKAAGTLSIVETPPANIEIVSLKVVPGDAIISAGSTLQFKAYAVLNDGSEVEVTNDSAWLSNNTAFVTLSPSTQGLATGKSIGQTMVIATYKDLAAHANVEVKDADLLSLQVTPASVVMYNGEVQVFIATGTYGDGSKRDVSAISKWTSANPAIGTFSSAGIGNSFIAGNAGNTQVTASIGAISASAMVQVKVIPGAAVYRFGINFEDLDAIKNAGVIGSAGDVLVDYNDFVLCFNGKARVDGQAITSLENQKIVFFTAHDSVCSHSATVEVYTKDSMGKEVILQSYGAFATPNEILSPEINFPKFAMIRAKIDITDYNDCTRDRNLAPGVKATITSADFTQVEVLQNVCRFKNPPKYEIPAPVVVP